MRFLVLCLSVMSLRFGACSDAETPNANFGVEAGPEDVDAGAERGTRDQPCLPNAECEGTTLRGVNNPEPTCRLLCDRDADPDPCVPDGQVCAAIFDAGDAVCAVP